MHTTSASRGALTLPAESALPGDVGSPAVSAAGQVVYAVVPVFNRLSETLRCLECLGRQTWHPLEIIVSDGGSAEGTLDVIERTLPDVQLLRAERELWWAGAAAAGIEHALRRAASADDFLLLLNNDTEFDPDYVARLVDASRRYDACVSGVVVDRERPGRVLEAGVMLNRADFTFRHRTELAPDERFWDGTDVLPAYGLLIPVPMLRAVGDLKVRRYPHYLSDYDLTMRLRRAGFRLGIVADAVIRVHATDLPLPDGFISPRRVVIAALNRKSKTNILDRFRFIQDHAAAAGRWRLRLAVLGRALRLFMLNRAALDRLGNRYRRGGGGPIDRRRALRYYRLAAVLGHSNAMNNIGTMYMRGEGVPQDYARARRWFERALRRGNAYAPDNLARMYRDGRGVEPNLERAHHYATMARARGFWPARDRAAGPATLAASDPGGAGR